MVHLAPNKPVSEAPAPIAARRTVQQVEEGLALAPKFDADGLIPCITADADGVDALMLGYTKREALAQTISTGEAHYWSRSCSAFGAKGRPAVLFKMLLRCASTTTRTLSGCASGSLVPAPVVTSDIVPASSGLLSSAALLKNRLGSHLRSQRNLSILSPFKATHRTRRSFAGPRNTSSNSDTSQS